MNMYQMVIGSAVAKKEVGRRKHRILKGNLYSKVRLMEPELALGQKPKTQRAGEGNLGSRVADGLKERWSLCGYTEWAESLQEMKWDDRKGAAGVSVLVSLGTSLVRACLCPISRHDFPRIFLAPFWKQTTMKQGRKQEGLVVAWTRGSNGGRGGSGFRQTSNLGSRLYKNIRVARGKGWVLGLNLEGGFLVIDWKRHQEQF